MKRREEREGKRERSNSRPIRPPRASRRASRWILQERKKEGRVSQPFSISQLSKPWRNDASARLTILLLPVTPVSSSSNTTPTRFPNPVLLLVLPSLTPSRNRTIPQLPRAHPLRQIRVVEQRLERFVVDLLGELLLGSEVSSGFGRGGSSDGDGSGGAIFAFPLWVKREGRGRGVRKGRGRGRGSRNETDLLLGSILSIGISLSFGLFD